MKSILLFVYAIPFLTNAQTVEFIEPRTVQQFPNVNYTPIKTSTHFYMYMDKYNMKSAVNRDMQLDVYSTGLKTSATAKIEGGSLEFNDANIYEAVLKLGDNLYLFKYHFLKKETKLSLNYYPISTSAERGKGTELTSFMAEKAMNSGNFTVVASPDGSKLAVLGELPAEKELNEKCIVRVYDASFKQLWEKTCEFPYPSSKGPRNNVFVNNQGVVFVEKRVPVKKGIDFHTLFTFSSNGTKVTETKLSLVQDAILSTYKTAFDADGNLYMAGFYYIDKKVGVNVETPDGPFYIKVNATDGSIPVQVASKSKLLQNLKTTAMILQADNSIILTGEQQYEKSTPKPGTTTFEYDYDYNNMAILTCKLNADGNKAWENVIERDITSRNDNGKLNSVFTCVLGNKIVLIYRDYLYKHDGQQHSVVGPGLANVFIDAVTTYETDGKQVNDTYITDQRIGNKKGEYFLIPASGYKLDDSSIWMMGTRSMELVSVKLTF